LRMTEKRRTLIVEDEDLIRFALESVLVEEGCDVCAARDGGEALRMLESECVPDLILLDLMMPHMDGGEFRRRQRQMAHVADVPVIVLSGARELRARAEALGAAAALAKPFELEDLAGTIRRVLASTG
jgi:CheY-like chemotaxis protein